MSEDNTQPEFFEKWPKEDMVYELVRLNKLLKEIAKISTEHNSLEEL